MSVSDRDFQLGLRTRRIVGLALLFIVITHAQTLAQNSCVSHASRIDSELLAAAASELGCVELAGQDEGPSAVVCSAFRPIMMEGRLTPTRCEDGGEPIPVLAETAEALASAYRDAGATDGDIQNAARLFAASVSMGNHGALSLLAEVLREAARHSNVEPDSLHVDFAISELLEAGRRDGEPHFLRQAGDLVAGWHPESLDHAVEIYEEAASAGDLPSLVRAGRILADDELAPSNIDRGIELLRQAATSGQVDAWEPLGDALVLRRDGESDVQGAAAAYAEATTEGDTSAYIRLARLLAEGTFPGFNLDTALMAYEDAALAGDPNALREAGDILRRRYGDDPVALEHAASYYARALEAGDERVWTRYAAILAMPDLAVFDPEKAIVLLESAIAAGQTEAMIQLGDIYRRGTAGETDLGLAIALYETAYGSGEIRRASARLGAIHGDPRSPYFDPVHALRYYRAYYQTGGDDLSVATIAKLLRTAPLRSDQAVEVMSFLCEVAERPLLRQEMQALLTPTAFRNVITAIQSVLFSQGDMSDIPDGLYGSGSIQAVSLYCFEAGLYSCSDGTITEELIFSIFYKN